MEYISNLFFRTTVFSPFRRTKRAENTACKSQDRELGAREEQSTAGPSAGGDLQVSDLLAEPFRQIGTPLVEMNEDGEVVVDCSVCYVINCQICPRLLDSQQLLMRLERALTEIDAVFAGPFRRGAPTVGSDSSSVEDSASTSSEEDETGEQAGRKERRNGKGGSNGRNSLGWSKLCARLSRIFPYKSSPNLPTQNSSPLDALKPSQSTPSPSRFAKHFARLRRRRKKFTPIDF